MVGGGLRDSLAPIARRGKSGVSRRPSLGKREREGPGVVVLEEGTQLQLAKVRCSPFAPCRRV